MSLRGEQQYLELLVAQLFERRAFAGDLPPDDPRLSPLMARYPGLPRAYLSVGAEEILRDDTERLAARLAEGGTRVTAHTVPGAPHVLALLAPMVPEARAELRRIAAWINAGIDRGIGGGGGG